MKISSDYVDLLRALNDAGAEYLIDIERLDQATRTATSDDEPSR